MLVPTHQRTDGTIPVITIGLDSIDTKHLKKFKCSICGGTVFGYYDSVTFLLPVDGRNNNYGEHFIPAGKILDEHECTHRYKDDSGRLVRCRTIYLIHRG